MKKAIQISLVALFLIVLIGISAFASGKGKGYPQDHAAIKQAIAAGDYDAFKQALATNNINDNAPQKEITQDQFNQMVERQKTMTAKKVEMETAMKAVNQALDANDYNAWKTAIATIPKMQMLSQKITQANFPKLVELHQAQQKVDSLEQELGLGMHNQISDSEKTSGFQGRFYGGMNGFNGFGMHGKNGESGFAKQKFATRATTSEVPQLE